jgi:hypothetical protein
VQGLPALFRAPTFGNNEHKKVMKGVINTLFALEFGSDLSPTQATGHVDDTPQEVVLYPLLLGNRLVQFAEAALALFYEAQHNEGGRVPTAPRLFNWSHVLLLGNYVQKVVLRVQTHTRNATRVPVNTQPFFTCDTI